jgi:hypothetical protein
MDSSLPPDLVHLRPGLGIIRLAALFAEARGDIDEESLDSMRRVFSNRRSRPKCGPNWRAA